MSLPTWGLLMVAFGVVIYVLLLAFARLDEMEDDLPRVTEQEKREALRVVSKVRVHDWEESGEL